MPNGNEVKADRILELNPTHPLFEAIEKKYHSNSESINDYATLLYHQALLIEGLPIEDPTEYLKTLTDLMIKSAL